MKNFKQPSLLWLSFLIIFIFIACTKQSPVFSGNDKSPQTPNAGATMQSIFFNNITIDSAQHYTFSITAITQAVIDSGSVVAYATDPSEQTAQWQTLPIINGCSLRLEVTALTEGKVEIQNNLGASVTRSYRFDITSAQ
jgi:hypothetical protein